MEWLSTHPMSAARAERLKAELAALPKKSAGTVYLRLEIGAGFTGILGVYPSNAVLLRQTSCRHLCRSRSQEILDVLQRIRLRFLGTCGLASASSSLSLATKDYSGRLLAGRHPMNQRRAIRIGVIADTYGLFAPAIRRHFRGVDHILHAGDRREEERVTVPGSMLTDRWTCLLAEGASQ